MAGTWSVISNAPPASVVTMFLLTDGSVLAQGASTNQWYRLRPDANGNYANGTWTTRAASANAPLYYASGILRDGRLMVAGGEYNNGAMAQLLAAEIYDPVADTWTSLGTPAGWFQIGDAPGCVLPDGRFFVGQIGTRQTAIYDPVSNTWTATADKISRCGEESWSLLPDGTIHAVDCSNAPNAEKYVIAADTWVAAGATPQTLVDGISEIGASVLLTDGRLFVIGATAFTAIYTMPPIANQPGTWVDGPTIPNGPNGEALGAVDAPAAVLPNGNVLFSVCPITVPATFGSPSYFFEYDPVANTIDNVPEPGTFNGVCYAGRMMVLPTGQVLYTNGTTQVEMYTPSGTFDATWRPSITSAPSTIAPGGTYTLMGRQLNGLSQCVYYGNDATQATNYPIVRLQSQTSSAVYYCRTSNFSTMGLQTGTVIHSCDFTVPMTLPYGCYDLVVVANGIPSPSRTVCYSRKGLKELKVEIKEKFERFELEKRIFDVQKRMPDFIDPKLIRENIDFGMLEDDWIRHAREFAQTFDQMQQRYARAFIKPDERPEVGPPPPLVTKVKPRKISAAEARKHQVKQAYFDGTAEKQHSAEMKEFHDKIHALVRSRDGDEVRVARGKGKAPRGKAARGKAVRGKAVRDRRRR
jgi:hypothetical protein